MNFVKLTEVGPRDGLQNESEIVSTDDKLEFLRLLRLSGLSSIEVTSFVRKDRIPQLSDAEDLSQRLQPARAQLEYMALVPNTKGYELARESGYSSIAIFTATSESFSEKNTNRSVKSSLEELKNIAKLARQDQIRVRGYISTVVYCPYEGKQKPEAALEIAKFLADEGIYEISLGETIGRAVPSEVEALISLLLREFPSTLFAGHFHDTFGTALANVGKALALGIRSFDSSAGGLGGCPYAQGAAGNIATEDILYFLEGEGFETNVDIDKVMKASRFIESKLNKTLPSKVYKALSNENAT